MHTGTLPGSMELVGDGQEQSGSSALLPTFLLTSSSSSSGWDCQAGLGTTCLRTRSSHKHSQTTKLVFHFILVSLFIPMLVVFMQTAFTTKKDYGKGEREAQWAVAQRTLHGLQVGETNKANHEQSEIAEQAKRRAEAARFSSSQT